MLLGSGEAVCQCLGYLKVKAGHISQLQGSTYQVFATSFSLTTKDWQKKFKINTYKVFHMFNIHHF